MTVLDAATYAGNPALKLPILRRGSEVVWGTDHICRTLTAEASRHHPICVAWPEEIASALARNAQELVWHGMAAQVQLVMGTVIALLPADNIFFVKTRTGMQASLAWLDQHVDEVLGTLPVDCELSLFEATLFCLVEHLAFRSTVSVAPYPALAAFAAAFGTSEAALATAYRMDQA